MKLMLTLLTLATVLPLAFQSSAAPLPLMPYPATVKSAPGHFSTAIRQSGPAAPLTVSLPADFPAELAAKSQYLLAHLSQRLSAQAGREVPVLLAKDKSKALLQIEFQQLITLPQPGDDESYQLQIKAQQIQLQAKNSTGVLYGLETLAQLLDCTVQPCQLPLVQITDQPRFSWRGLMLDSARRFIPLPDLKRQLQGMASARLNVLHWHLTDDQGWRFASNHYPRLTELEAAGEFYSQQQMRELVAYAAKLGIRVVPELDFPGHASTIARAYPHLMAAAGPYATERGFGVFAPVLDVSSSQVAEFIEKLLTEVVQIFPDPYLHIGGDEVKPDHWLANSAIQQYMQQNNLPDAAALHADFNLRLARQLTSLNRRMMGWDEVLHKDLPLSVLVQSWQGQDAVAASVRAGHPTLLSAGYYLDQPMPTSFHYRNDPVAVAQPLPQLTATSALQLEFSLLRLNNKPVQGQMLLVPATVDKSSGTSIDTPPQVRLRVPNRGLLAARQVQQSSRSGNSSGDSSADSSGNSWQFALDSWLGPGEFQLTQQADGQWQASVMIGNTPYPLQISATSTVTDFSTWQAPVKGLTAAEQHLILGGEAALWSELAPADLLDLKLWPRLYAVAERLWSPASVQDEASMYQRLQVMDHYGARLGLQHQQQQQQALRRFTADPAQQAALVVLTEVVEPAQYYSRHHLKTVRGQYHLDAPLDRFADALAAESLTLQRLQLQLEALDCRQPESMKALPLQFQRWQQAALKLQNYQGLQQPRIRQLATELAQTSDIALQWLAARQQHQPPSQQQLQQWQAALWQITSAFDEEVLALAHTLQPLLRQCSAGPQGR